MRKLDLAAAPVCTECPALPDHPPRALINRGAAARRIVLASFLLASLLAPLATHAATVLYRTDAELIALSERVVHARVLGHRFERPSGSAGAIYTVTTLAVLEDFTGIEDETVVVWELGGVVGTEVMFVGGEVRYRAGSEVLVCLGRGRLGLRSIAMGFSKFDIAPVTAADGSADGQLTRNLRETSIVGGPVQGSERTLSEFRSLAAAVRGVSSRRHDAAAALVPGGSVSEAFTLLPFSNGLGARWVEADSGVTIRYYRNSAATFPLVSGNVDTEIQKALSAWTDPQGASIALQYAGLASPSVPREPVSSTGTTVISFEDPDEEISSPTLAMGGGFASLGGGGTVNGATFNRFTSAFIIVQNAADLPASFREPTDFSRVLEHEVGHTIGLGHSPDPQSIMYTSCCSTSTPVAPALGADDLNGLHFIYPASAAVCSFSISPSSASVASTATTGTVDVFSESSCSWTASTRARFVSLSSSGASGSGSVTYSVEANSGSDRRIATLTIAGQTFTITQAGAAPAATPPFGVVDTPQDHASGVTGSIPVSGWALDDVQVASVKVYRDPVAGETAGVLVYVGDATFVPGARPDVAAAYPATPFNTRAGWGYLLLTNALPDRGTGTYRLHVYATDVEGNLKLLGFRTITCTNNIATAPFGAIDTPTQGGVVAGAIYDNFGWVLARDPRRADPPGGGSVQVVIDGAVVGSPAGWTSRSDLSAAFPAAMYPGVNTALGVYTFSTTGLTDGLHTIAWSVTDHLGGAAGVGSRYFTVANAAPLTAFAEGTAQHLTPKDIRDAVHEPAVITGRRGFALDAPLRRFRPDANGVVIIHAEEVDRVELHLASAAGVGGDSGHAYAGYLRAGSALAALPIGSTLDSASGQFTWLPGAGFIGAYDLVFVRSRDGRAIERQEVRIVVNPKASGRVGSQTLIDTPAPQQKVGQPFAVAGWAVDLDDEVGTGVDALHVWAYPLSGGDPIFLGAASYGAARPDVAAVYGDRFRASGYSLTIERLGPGDYDLAAFAWSTAAGGFAPAKTVRVTVR